MAKLPPQLNLLTFDQIAALHYRERLVFDEELRNTDHRYAAYGFIDDQLIDDQTCRDYGALEFRAGTGTGGTLASRRRRVLF